MKKSNHRIYTKKEQSDIDKQIGNNLRNLRKTLNLGLLDIARSFSVSHQQVQKYESGENRLPGSKIVILRDEFGVDVDSLLPHLDDYKPKRLVLVKEDMVFLHQAKSLSRAKYQVLRKLVKDMLEEDN